jgi:hypothetical protein
MRSRRAPGGVSVRESLERLEDHDRGHLIGRDRGASTTRREEILEHLVGEQLVAVIGQEGLHASLGDELATQSCCVEELRVRFAVSLHAAILDDPQPNREHRRVLCSTVS